MEELLLVALAGFCAAVVDGALGMGFGPTSSTILLSSGLSPAAASTTVNLAKVVTGFAGAVAHWRFSNIDHKLVLRLAGPGVVGAALGATVLARVDGDAIRPLLALLLLVIGVRILLRFSRRVVARSADPAPDVDAAVEAGPGPDPVGAGAEGPGVSVAAGIGGVTNGLVGAWGPVVTPVLMHRGVPPRYAIGSVNTAEVAVAVVAAGSLLSSGNGAGLDLGIVAAMLAGGLVGAPLAAGVVRYIPARVLGLACAALLMITQTHALVGGGHVPVPGWVAYPVIAVVVAVAALRPRLEQRRTPAAAESVGSR
ncbi:MAG: sulfite exporter TauE/SafE family protein [Acidimicrobiales bacterium]